MFLFYIVCWIGLTNEQFFYFFFVDGTRLKANDYGCLCGKLRSCAARWEQIAESLGFTYPEISIIEANPRSRGPTSYLGNMIGDWLEWAPGDARGSEDYATLEHLQLAVSEAGFGVVASKLTRGKQVGDRVSLGAEVCNSKIFPCQSKIIGSHFIFTLWTSTPSVIYLFTGFGMDNVLTSGCDLHKKYHSWCFLLFYFSSCLLLLLLDADCVFGKAEASPVDEDATSQGILFICMP
jgi:hypothetical protein